VTTPSKFTFALLLSISLPACGSENASSEIAPDASTVPAKVTYYEDIKPLIDAKCATCHLEGGIAPFSLTSYDDAKAHAGISMLAIDDGIMPPWKPNSDCNEYHGERSLTLAQKELFAAWVSQETPEGSPQQEGPPIPLEEVGVSRIDTSLMMAESYTPTLAPDDYRCFILPWPEEFDADKYVTGFRATPGNAKIVHHVIAFIAGPEQVADFEQMDADEAGPGYTCFGGPGGPAQGGLGGWVPGTRGTDFPEGTGIKIEPGSAIILQVHYNAVVDTIETDATSLDLRIADDVDKEAFMMGWLDPQWVQGAMSIPAAEQEVTHSFEFSPVTALNLLGVSSANEITVYNAGLHMHNLGKSAKLEVVRGGESDCMLQIDDWDFQWQGEYALREPMQLTASDLLQIECTWDNSPQNQPILDGSPLPPQNVNWGEGTRDEMCLGTFYWTAAD
jgi:hypothetical protein